MNSPTKTAGRRAVGVSLPMLLIALCGSSLWSQEGPPRQEMQEREVQENRRRERDEMLNRARREAEQERARSVRVMRQAIERLRSEGQHEEAERLAREIEMRERSEWRQAGTRAEEYRGPRDRAPDTQIEHVEQAIQHLQAAGMQDLAAQVKERAGQILAERRGPRPPEAPETEHFARALRQVQEAVGNIERRIRGSEELARAMDQAHHRINELSGLAEHHAREMEEVLGRRLQEMERHFSERMEGLERGLGEFVERSQDELNDRLEAFVQEQREAQREREEIEAREREEMERREIEEREEMERREIEEREEMERREREELEERHEHEHDEGHEAEHEHDEGHEE